MEFIQSAVRVNAVAPGPTPTEAVSRMFGSQDKFEEFFKVKSRPEERANPRRLPRRCCPWLPPQSSFVVGQILTVDGGLTAQ